MKKQKKLKRFPWIVVVLYSHDECCHADEEFNEPCPDKNRHLWIERVSALDEKEALKLALEWMNDPWVTVIRTLVKPQREKFIVNARRIKGEFK